MNWKLRLTAVVAGLVQCVSLDANAASAEHGKAVFMQKGCWQCHGTQGQGAVTGPRLAPEPLAFETFATFVRSSNRNMPPYRAAVLSDADLADIYAYLQSVPKPVDVKATPLLQQWPDKPK